MKKDKIIAGIYILATSFYIATMVHEVGHAIIFKIFGCKKIKIWVNAISAGFTKCYNPTNFYVNDIEKKLLLNSSGILFVVLMGIIFLFIYNYIKSVKNNYIFLYLVYFLAFAFLLNGFG